MGMSGKVGLREEGHFLPQDQKEGKDRQRCGYPGVKRGQTIEPMFHSQLCHSLLVSYLTSCSSSLISVSSFIRWT